MCDGHACCFDWNRGFAGLRGPISPHAIIEFLKRGLRVQGSLVRAFDSMVADDASSSASAHDLLPLTKTLNFSKFVTHGPRQPSA